MLSRWLPSGKANESYDFSGWVSFPSHMYLRLNDTDPCFAFTEHINPSVYLNLFSSPKLKEEKQQRYTTTRKFPINFIKCEQQIHYPSAFTLARVSGKQGFRKRLPGVHMKVVMKERMLGKGRRRRVKRQSRLLVWAQYWWAWQIN